MGPGESKDSKPLDEAEDQNNLQSPITEISKQSNNGRSFQMDDSGGVEGVEVFEDLLDLVGTSGPWNIMIFILCTLSSGMACLQNMSYEFIGATPDHWCRVDELLEANWTQKQILDFAIPTKNNSKHERCQMYDYNYTYVAELGYESAMESLAPEIQNSDNIIPCHSRDFDRSQYQSTLVTEFDLVCERRALYSTTQASSQLGVLIGSLSIGQLSDIFGRRRSTLFFVSLFLACGLGASISTSLGVYIALKILTCACAFGCYIGCFVTMIEICSPSQRSSLGSLFLIPWAIFYMLVPGIAYLVRPWRLLQMAYTLPVVLLCSYFWLMPESPRWLISKGRYKEAVEVLSWAAKVNKKVLPPQENLVISMKKMARTDNEGQNGNVRSNILNKIKNIFALVLIPEFRMRAVICAICWVSVATIYYGVSLGSSNLSADPYLYVFLGGVTEIPSYVLLWPSVAYLGRKFTLISQHLFCGLVIAIIGVILYTYDEAPVGVLMFLSLSGKLAITATFHLIYIYTSELFPTKYRSLAVGEGSVIGRLGSMASPYIIDIMGNAISWGPSVLFAGLSVLAASLALMLPETKDAAMNEGKSFQGKTKKRKDNNKCKNREVDGSLDLSGDTRV